MSAQPTARFAAYALAHGRDPEAQLAHDRGRFPGGRMAGYIVWIGGRLRAWRSATGRAPDAPMDGADHAAFDRWLGVLAEAA